MLQIEVPIYYNEINPRSAKKAVMGMNWYAHSCNVFKKGTRGNTTAALTKKLFHQLIDDHRQSILDNCDENMTEHEHGYHVHYDVYVGRLGTDGHNVRSVMEKFVLDALEESELIDNDKFVYSTSSRFFLNRDEPGIVISVFKHREDVGYEQDGQKRLPIPEIKLDKFTYNN